MNVLKKIIALILISIFSLFTLTGCKYENNSIENLAYVIALGIDKGEDNLLKLSFQFATPSSDSGSSGSSGSDITTTTVECSSISSGFNLMNSYISKKLNLSHCKVIIFSEELAAIGITEEVQTLINKIQIRPDSSIIISKCSASDFIENAKPNLMTLIARYYEIVVTSGKYTGYYYNSTLENFYSSLEESLVEATAMLGGTNVEQLHYIDKDINYIDIDSSYIAGTSLVEDENLIQLMGTAVFKDGKLVGELNGQETISHLIVTNKLDQCIINIPDPFSSDNLISVSISLNNTNNKVEFVNNASYIMVDTSIEAYILTYSDSSNYGTEEALGIIEKYINSYLATHISSYLYKTAKEFNSDIAGFGKKVISKYTNINKWNESNWSNNYKNAFFHVNVSTDLEGSTLMINN